MLIWLAGRNDDGVDLTHVHGLGVNPADGDLYIATHDGLYRIPASGGPTRRVADTLGDFMGFTVTGPNTFLASGHPAVGQDSPAHLGLIESADAGRTWKTLSLPGDADFHALRHRHGTVYGYNSVRGQLMVSTDGTTWQTRSTLGLRDFDVSPADPKALLATTEAGVQRSGDGGVTWAPVGGPPLVLLAWETTDRLWGVGSNELLRSIDGGTSWTPAGRLPGPVSAFSAHNGTLYAAVHEQGVYRTSDGGATWHKLYRQT